MSAISCTHAIVKDRKCVFCETVIEHPLPVETSKPADLPRYNSAETDEKISKAQKMVSDLCHRRRDWTMSIPADESCDPDLVIGNGLRAAQIELIFRRSESAAHISEVERLTKELNTERASNMRLRSDVAAAQKKSAEDLDYAKEQEKERKTAESKLSQLQTIILFFASVIKSGESWSKTCEERLREALR